MEKLNNPTLNGCEIHFILQFAVHKGFFSDNWWGIGQHCLDGNMSKVEGKSVLFMSVYVKSYIKPEQNIMEKSGYARLYAIFL